MSEEEEKRNFSLKSEKGDKRFSYTHTQIREAALRMYETPKEDPNKIAVVDYFFSKTSVPDVRNAVHMVIAFDILQRGEITPDQIKNLKQILP